MQSEKTFDARKAITGATYPTDSIDVYSDAELAHELNIVANDAAKARFLADTIKAKYVPDTVEAGPEDAPGWTDAEAEAIKLEHEVAALVSKLRGSVLTFHVRGLAPAQWRLIDAKWRKGIKPPARKNFPQTEDGEEEYELAVHERNILRTAAINNDTVASAITKVVRKHDGATDTSVWSLDDVAVINDNYLESEYTKVKTLVEQLTFANNLFNIAVEQDADFLSKP
jgi:hypothetical protein